MSADKSLLDAMTAETFTSAIGRALRDGEVRVAAGILNLMAVRFPLEADILRQAILAAAEEPS